jgi:hypothetical protein
MKHIISIFLFLVSINVFATIPNYGFETNTLSGWTPGGGSALHSASGWSGNGVGVSVITGVTNFSPGGGKTWTVTPYGSYMAAIQPGSGAGTFDQMTNALGLTSTSNTAIRNMLTTQSQTGGGNPTPTNASWISKTVTLTAGTTYTYAWQYISSDYTPFNDGSIITLSHASNPSITGTVNNKNSQYALLGFTNPGTGDYSTNSYGSTGWQVATFTVSVDGDYTLGFAAFNLGDTILSPILLIDEVQGSTLLNGQPFAPVAPNPGSGAPAAPTIPSLCCGGSSNAFSRLPSHDTDLLQFQNRTTADSKVYINQIGDSNEIEINQEGTHNNYAKYTGNGNSNNIDISQSSTNSSATNYTDLTVNGNSNNATITQQSTGGNKAAFATVLNNNNTVNILQKDSGSHYASVNLDGGNKNVDVTQEGSGNHMANVTLTGNPTDLSLTQSGSNQQFYSIMFNCATAGGCDPISVQQGQ